MMEILLHPVRMRIIQTFIQNPRQTVQQIGELIPDVPQATLYRNLNKLLQAEIVTVVEENQIRGTVEKVYSLSGQATQKTTAEIEQASRDDHFKYFFTFLVNLLGEFEKYIEQPNFNFKEDGLGYRQASIYVTDAEFAELLKTIGNTIFQAAQNKPAPGRKRRTIATINIPDAK